MSKIENLQTQNLHFGYPRVEILKGINFEAKQGEFVGILGPNGCGKSTLLKNFLKILTPNDGIVKIGDYSLKDFKQKELAKLLGFVPQKSSLMQPLLTEDVLLMGRYTNNSGFGGYKAEDYAKIKQIAKILDIEKFFGRVAISLSGGEFQRVLLGRALVGEPRALLLDEPTSALDLNYSIEILRICQHVIAEENMIGIIVLHDLNLASLFCHRIVLMKAGQIRYNGTPKELFKKEILKEIYGLDCEVLEHDGRPFIVPINNLITKDTL